MYQTSWYLLSSILTHNRTARKHILVPSLSKASQFLPCIFLVQSFCYFPLLQNLKNTLQTLVVKRQALVEFTDVAFTIRDFSHCQLPSKQCYYRSSNFHKRRSCVSYADSLKIKIFFISIRLETIFTSCLIKSD